MQNANRQAFKEWAVVCAALAAGRQSLLLRKGGVHERGGRFEVEHREFWLFPTHFHQNPDEIREDACDLLQIVAADPPPAKTIQLSLYAVVEEVLELRDPMPLPGLARLQILTERILTERFHYRRPGLFILPVRIYRRAQPIAIADSPGFAGCRTWVELPESMSTADLTPAVPDGAYEQQLAAIRSALSASRLPD